MSMQLDASLVNTGTRFRIYPQPRFLGFPLETITVSVPPGDMKPGPEDDRMFVADALNKLPYSQLNRPPFHGRKNPPVKPGADGHFDRIDPNSPEFTCATMYATVRRVLDIWEDYFGSVGSIPWHFESDFEKLELIPRIEWDNAQSGYGFLEFGFGRNVNGGIDRTRPYCENFDVLAHELGHSIIFSKVSAPAHPANETNDYGGMHESAGDLVAIIALLHFNTMVDRLLKNTKGNLFTVNELDRVGELSDSREIRMAFNNLRMSDVSDEPHDRSVPLTGAIFDVMVEVFQKNLVVKGLISPELAEMSTQGSDSIGSENTIRLGFDTAYQGKEKEFKEALLQARDYMGRLLADCWSNLDPNFLTYHTILQQLFRSDRTISSGEHQRTIRECFAWREISMLPTSLMLKSHTLRECGLRR